jgi:hypothetical protein
LLGFVAALLDVELSERAADYWQRSIIEAMTAHGGRSKPTPLTVLSTV